MDGTRRTSATLVTADEASFPSSQPTFRAPSSLPCPSLKWRPVARLLGTGPLASLPRRPPAQAQTHPGEPATPHCCLNSTNPRRAAAVRSTPSLYRPRLRTGEGYRRWSATWRLIIDCRLCRRSVGRCGGGLVMIIMLMAHPQLTKKRQPKFDGFSRRLELECLLHDGNISAAN